MALNAAAARYTRSEPACVIGIAPNDRLNVRSRPTANSRILGSLAPSVCGMGIEAVEGNWTFIRGSDRGRNVQGGGTTACCALNKTKTHMGEAVVLPFAQRPEAASSGAVRVPTSASRSKAPTIRRRAPRHGARSSISATKAFP